jgi:hypothetical protein
MNYASFATQEQGRADARSDLEQGWLDATEYTAEELEQQLALQVGASGAYIEGYVAEVAVQS